MECPHLDRVTRQAVSGVVTAPSWPSLTDPGVKLECGECGATESVWICVTCGALNCGRYIKAHGLMHKVRKKGIMSILNLPEQQALKIQKCLFPIYFQINQLFRRKTRVTFVAWT